MKDLRSKVGIVFQYPEHKLFEETGKKDIAFGPLNFGIDEAVIEERMEEILPAVGLNPELLERSPFELSGGQMRRVAIAGVLATQPDVYVLDEPTAGLDPRGQKEIMNLFRDIHKREKATTVLVTHDMEDALRYADYIVIINKGQKYMEGTPADIFTQEEAIRDVHLHLPQSIQFINQFNKRFNSNIPLEKHSLIELSEEVVQTVRGSKHG